MKKLLMLLQALLFTWGSTVAASTENLSQNLSITNVCNLTESALNEIMLGQHPEIAIEFSAQTTLPISFFLKGDFVSLLENAENLGLVEINQTFYARCVNEGLILSTDLTEWKPFLEFITGSVSVSIKTQEGKPFVTVGAEANQRI